MPIPIPIPDIAPLNPPLGADPPLPAKKVESVSETAKYSPIQAVLLGLAAGAPRRPTR